MTIKHTSTIGALCDVKGGKRLPKGEQYTSEQTTHPYLRVTDFRNRTIDETDLRYISKETHSQIARYTISSDDVYISIAGSLGITGVVPHHLSGANLTENAAKLVIRDKSALYRDYLAHFLSTIGQRFIQQKSVATSQPKLALFRIEEIPIPLPPLSEQKRIADILDKADTIRRKRQQVTKELASLPVAAFDEIFGSPSSNPLELPTVELKELITSGDKINYGIVQPGKDVADGVPVVRVGDMQQLHVSLDGLKRVDPSIDQRHAKSRLIGDEILVACVGSIGLVALADDRLNGFNIVRAIARIRCNERVTREYLAAYLSTPAVQNYFKRSTRTVSQPTLNIKQIEETPVLVPPMELQERFTLLVSATADAASRSSTAVSEADGLFASLVQRAFRGEL